jgi:hypothetical protein
VRTFRTLIIPGLVGGFLSFTERPPPHGYSPAEGDFVGSAILHLPKTSLGTEICLTRADQLDLLYFLSAPEHVTGGFPYRSRYASPCNLLRLVLTIDRPKGGRASSSLSVEVTNQSRRGTSELRGRLLLTVGFPSEKEIARFFPGTSTDDLDLDAPDGEHLSLLERILDRWPCRSLVERKGSDGLFHYGSLIQPVARRLYYDASEDELAEYLQARVAEARGEANEARDRAFARELLGFHAEWRRKRDEDHFRRAARYGRFDV